MTIEQILQRLSGVRRRGGGWIARCPAHEDRNPSLSIHEVDGTILLHCFAGCRFKEVVAAMGLTERDFFADNAERVPVACYDYANENGVLLYQVVRFRPKDFRQRRPDGTGGWIWNLDGVRGVLYNLPEVLKTKSVLICEGERDADTARKLGLVGTTNSGGAGKWRREFSEALRGKRVVIIADADELGCKHARDVARSLVGLAEVVKLIELPGAKDLTAWLEGGGTREQLLDILKKAPELTPADVGAWTTASRSPHSSANPWAAALSAREFLTQAVTEAEFLIPRLLAKGTITEIFSPRGIGKTLLAIRLAVKLALEGLRVLYLNRDNPPRVLRKFLEGWHAGDAEALKVLNREQVPPLTNVAAWAMFPWNEYDVVIVDSFDSTAEGVGEKDSSKPSLALAPLLDIAHREGGPAVLVLGNTVRTGAHSRGSGVVEDRADIVFEVRDVTGFTPSGNKPWWEELPPAGAGDWAARATRRQRREKIRLAFIPTKFRASEEPEPFAFRIDFTTDPWSLKEITDDIDQAGAEAREARRRERDETENRAADALKAEIARRVVGKEPPRPVRAGRCPSPRSALGQA